MRLRAALPFILVGFSLTPAAWAQQVSRNKDIAVFRLSYCQWDIPDSAVAAVDEEIRRTFIDLGRFEVLGLTQRLESGDLGAFGDAIRQYRAKRVDSPQEVQVGREFLTLADFELLAGSLLVVPSVASYLLEASGGGFHVLLKTSFTFIDMEQDRGFARALVESEGSEESPEGAARRAMDGVAPKLAYELRRIPELQPTTGVLEVHGSAVTLEPGRELGVRVGDEYLRISKTLSSETGLLVVKEVSDRISVARLIYASPGLREGDPLRELPLLGMETTPYVHVASGLFHPRGVMALAGLRQSVSRGFYGLRPIFGLEAPLLPNILVAIPLNLYLGAEYVIRTGRLQVAPHASLGVGGAYLAKFAITHIGGTTGLNLSYLLANRLLLLLETGYLSWFSLIPTRVFAGGLSFPDYDGLYFGAGLTIKL